MKKFKEFLWFLIPFILLSIISVVFFILQLKNADVIGFMGGTQYLKLMISDPFMIIALINTFIPPVIIGAVLCAVYKFITLALRKKLPITRKADYIILLAIGFITSIIYIIALTKRFDFTNNLVFALQVSLIVTFVYWLVELVVDKFKRENNK